MIAINLFLLLLIPFLTIGSFESEAKDVDEYSTSSATYSASSSPLHGLIFDPSNSHVFIRNRRMDSQNTIGRQTSVETDVDLDVLYRISEPEIFYCETSASFAIRYKISDWITDDMCQYRMYRRDDNGDPTIDITDNPYMAPELLFDETPQGNGIGDRTVLYFIKADSSLILSSPIYHGTQPGDPLHKLPYITFSTQFELWNSDVGGLVNWFEMEFFFYLQLTNLQFTEHLRKLELENSYPTPLNDAPVENAGSDADEIVGTDDRSGALEPTWASEDKESSSLPSVASDIGTSKLLRKISKTKEGVKQPYYGTDDMLPYPEHMHHNDHRQLLRCFDGFEITSLFVDGESNVTQAPSVSSAPTITPAPTAPTTSQSPSTAPTDKGIVIGRPHSTNFTETEAGDDAFGVFGYLCDENLDPIAKTENPFGSAAFDGEHYAIHEQGTQVRVCVERNSKCVRGQIYLKHIDAFSFFKASDASIRQVAIEPVAIPANNGLTEVTCSRGSHKCYFDTLLVADFYLESGIMYGNGKATLQFGSSSASSRWLHNVDNDDDDQRQLQDDRDEGGLEDAIGTISFKFAFLKPEDLEELVDRKRGPVFANDSEGTVDADEIPAFVYMIPWFLAVLVLLCCIAIKVRNCRNAKCRHAQQEKEGQENKTVSITVRRHRRRKATVSLTDDGDGSCRSRSPSRRSSSISDDNELCSPNSTRSTRSASRSSRSRRSNRSSSRRGRTTVFLTDDGGGSCRSRSRSRSRRSSAISGDNELCSPNSTRSTRSRRSDRSRSSSRRRRSIALSVPSGDDEFDCRNSTRSARSSNRSSRSRRSIRSCRSRSIRECDTRRWLDDDDDDDNEDANVEKTSERSSHGNHYKSYSRRVHRSFDDGTKDEARTHHTRRLSALSKEKTRKNKEKTRSNRWLFDDSDEERDDDLFVDETLQVEEGRRSKRKSRSQI